MSWWPQTTLFSCMLRLPVEGQDFAEATTPTTPSTAEEDMTGCTPHCLEQKEEISTYLLSLPL